MAHRTLYTHAATTALGIAVIGAGGLLTISLERPSMATEVEHGAMLEDRASEILRAWSAHLDSLDAYSTEVAQRMRMRGPFGDDDSSDSFNFAARKPNYLAVTTAMNEVVVSDGEKFFVSVPVYGSYVETVSPDDIKELFHKVQSDTMMLGNLPAALVTPLLGPGGVHGDLATLHEAKYGGTDEIDGEELHRVAMRFAPTINEASQRRFAAEMGPDARLEYFVDAFFIDENEPRLRRLHFDLAQMLAVMMPEMFEMMPEMKDMTYEITMTFSEWKTGQNVSEDLFAFSPPDSADKMESVDEMMAALMERAGGGGPSPDELLGQRAPDFEMQLLDGGTITGAQHHGNDIVILDFWATWCGPCIQAMPALMEVAEEYKDRNVIFYAVNVRENNETIEAFLKKHSWDLHVPMDRDGSVGNKFNVTGIPQTVIIDKDGTVQAVHVGFSSNLKNQLTSELDTLLAGRKLADPDSGETTE